MKNNLINNGHNKWANHFLKWHRLYAPILLFGWLIIHALTNTTSALMEAKRINSMLAWWEPLCWELSSAIIVAALAWPLAKLLSCWPMAWKLWQQACLHCLILIVFSTLHILGMVGMRELCYWAVGWDYEFGNWLYEFIYELRKDTITYISLVAVIYTYRFLLRRLRGEARLLASEKKSEETRIDKFLVKKLGKEFLISPNEINWVEASGNYANLHVAASVFPMRITMTKLIKQLPDHFIRIHRSTIVNINYVKHIEATSCGDYEVNLKDGSTVMLSRRYREAFKEHFEVSGYRDH